MKLLRPKVLWPVGLLALGGIGALVLVMTRPAVSIQEPEVPRPLVRVVDVVVEDVELRVRTNGTVKPRTESELVPEVTGPVVWMSPALVSGGSFAAGDPLFRIDRGDYEVEVERARASLERARSQFQLAERELGRRKDLASRNIASPRELDDATNAERVAAAAVREARASLERARRDLGRTEIVAPYAGRVRTESVDVGQFVSRGQRVATIYAVDYAEVRLPVPDQELAFVALPGITAAADAEGPPVVLHARFAGAEHSWQGRIVRTEGEIDPKSRVVYAVARVDDPYGSDQPGRPPLAVGLFVRAEIIGTTASDAVVLPRAALRQNDVVWVVDADERLRHRKVDVLRAEGDRVVIASGLRSGERVCVSPLQTAIDGMPVRAVDPREPRGPEGSPATASPETALESLS